VRPELAVAGEPLNGVLVHAALVRPELHEQVLQKAAVRHHRDALLRALSKRVKSRERERERAREEIHR